MSKLYRYRLEQWKLTQTNPFPIHVIKSDDYDELAEFGRDHVFALSSGGWYYKLIDTETGRNEKFIYSDTGTIVGYQAFGIGIMAGFIWALSHGAAAVAANILAGRR